MDQILKPKSCWTKSCYVLKATGLNKEARNLYYSTKTILLQPLHTTFPTALFCTFFSRKSTNFNHIIQTLMSMRFMQDAFKWLPNFRKKAVFTCSKTGSYHWPCAM